MGSLNKKPKSNVKIEELSGNDPAAIEDEIKNKLQEGWIYHSPIVKGNKVFLVFIR